MINMECDIDFENTFDDIEMEQPNEPQTQEKSTQTIEYPSKNFNIKYAIAILFTIISYLFFSNISFQKCV